MDELTERCNKLETINAELIEALRDLCDLLEDIRAVAPVAKQHAAARAAIKKATE